VMLAACLMPDAIVDLSLSRTPPSW
jgi:hypothetical protein